MKTKRWNGLALLMALLLAGCGPAAAPEAEAPPTEPEIAPAETAAPVADAAPVSSSADRWTVLTWDGVCAELIVSLDPDTAGAVYTVRVENDREEDLIVTLSELRLNGSVRVDGTVYCDAYAGTVTYGSASALSAPVEMVSREAVTRLSGRVEVLTEAFEPLYEGEWSAEAPDGLRPQIRFEPCLGAAAETQTLLDHDGLRVDLLGLGSLPDGYVTGQYLDGLLRFENRTDRAMPLWLCGLSINGVFLYKNEGGHVPAGKTTFASFRVSTDDLAEAGVSDIAEVSLLLLTSEEEQTGWFNYEGGDWYPVTLSVAGTDTAAEETGTTLFDNGELRIVSLDRTEGEYSLPGSGYYSWRLLVVNDSDENLELELDRQTVDGEERGLSYFEANSLFIPVLESRIGAHTKRYVNLMLTYDADNPVEVRPDITVRFGVYTMGGGARLYTTDEYAFPAEE